MPLSVIGERTFGGLAQTTINVSQLRKSDNAIVLCLVSFLLYGILHAVQGQVCAQLTAIWISTDNQPTKDRPLNWKNSDGDIPTTVIHSMFAVLR